MRFLRRTFSAMRRWEKILLLIFSLLLLISLTVLLRRFYLENTERVPVRGGTYIEGSVGTMRMLNPWFTVTNDVNRDITSLVFSGLQRYNPFSGQIEDDMAELSISGNNHIYALTLRDNLFWHDSTEEFPRPVTADDVVFTYTMIQQQGFPNPILQKNFRGIDIEKIDDRTVQFRLEKPYYFFRSNLTLGILPSRHFEGIPADRLIEVLDFNLSPIGSGPYTFKSIVETELATEVTLEHSPQFYGAKPYIERIVFRAFPDYSSLLSDLRNLDGVRHVPRNPQGRAIIPNRYQPFFYTLPQYVALFFNLHQEILQDEKLRLGLQLATNKQAIVDAINEETIIDTPLLEIAKEDWQYQFQPDAAQGALYDIDWHLPEKIRLQHLLENREVNTTGALMLPQPVVLLETGAALVLTGSSLDLNEPLFVNGIQVTVTEIHSTGSTNSRQAGSGLAGSWTIALPTDGSSGSILIGENSIRLTETGGVIVDSYILTRVTDRKTLQRLREEQLLIEEYLKREEDGIGIANLRLEKGALRQRKGEEPHGIRRNDAGEPLRLRLLTSARPPTYPDVAEEVAAQWRRIGVEVEVDVPEDRQAFENRVINRDYDVLLFGQPLLDNLDSYPYWHSSQIQTFKEAPGENGRQGVRLDANNLSQYTTFLADALLEQIRETHNPERRRDALKLLRDVYKEDVPAVVLYSPTYVFAVSEDILGVDLGKPSLHSDRFLGLHRWFIKQGRTFKTGSSWLSFFPWLSTLWITNS